jgi:hypothetical protein
MVNSIEFMGRDFGGGSFVEAKPHQDNFYKLLEHKRWQLLASSLGWSEGCPVVPEVIERDGAQGAAETYAELLFTRGIQQDIIRSYSPELAQKIAAGAPRNVSEPPGRYHEQSIPFDHSAKLRGVATLVGYNLPRLTREFIGPRESRTRERMLQAFEVFETVVRKSVHLNHTPIQFMVSLAEQYALIDNNAPKYLRRLLSDGKVKEDNLTTDAMLTLANAGTMETFLYHTYINTPPEKQRELGIAVLSNRK